MTIYRVVLSALISGDNHQIEFSGSTISEPNKHLIYLMPITTTTTTIGPCILECSIECNVPATTTTTTTIDCTISGGSAIYVETIPTTTTTTVGPTTTTTTVGTTTTTTTGPTTTTTTAGSTTTTTTGPTTTTTTGPTTTTTTGPTTTTTTAGSTTTTTTGPTTTTTTTPSQLRIMNVSTDCLNSSITITITGGVGPYKYSADNGTTLTNDTYLTSYTLTNLTGGVYTGYVQDSNNQMYRWEQYNCDQVTVTFETVYLTSYATGFIYDENYNPYTTSFSVTRDYLSVYNASSTAIGGSTFLGWTYSDGTKPTKSNMSQIVYETKLNNRTQLFDHDVTIYAIFDKSGPISLNFCYFPLSSGYIVTPTDLEFYCANCPQIITVYFNENQYNTYGYQNIIWYKDVNLSTTVDIGDYKLQGAINTTIYRLINGVATVDGTCPPGGSKLSCC